MGSLTLIVLDFNTLMASNHVTFSDGVNKAAEGGVKNDKKHFRPLGPFLQFMGCGALR